MRHILWLVLLNDWAFGLGYQPDLYTRALSLDDCPMRGETQRGCFREVLIPSDDRFSITINALSNGNFAIFFSYREFIRDSSEWLNSFHELPTTVMLQSVWNETEFRFKSAYGILSSIARYAKTHELEFKVDVTDEQSYLPLAREFERVIDEFLTQAESDATLSWEIDSQGNFLQPAANQDLIQVPVGDDFL